MELFIRKTSPRGFLKYVCFSNFRKEKKRKKRAVNIPRQYFDTREAEQFSVKIRKYPCLSGYKEKDRVEDAWKEISG